MIKKKTSIWLTLARGSGKGGSGFRGEHRCHMSTGTRRLLSRQLRMMKEKRTRRAKKQWETTLGRTCRYEEHCSSMGLGELGGNDEQAGCETATTEILGSTGAHDSFFLARLRRRSMTATSAFSCM